MMSSLKFGTHKSRMRNLKTFVNMSMRALSHLKHNKNEQLLILIWFYLKIFDAPVDQYCRNRMETEQCCTELAIGMFLVVPWRTTDAIGML